MFGFAGIFSPPPRRTQEIERSYSDSTWVRATTGKVASATAMPRFRLYAIKQDGKFIRDQSVQFAAFDSRQLAFADLRASDSLIEIREHPLLDLLSGGSTPFVGITLRELTQIYLDLVGEAFWFLQRDDLDVPRNAWPLPTHTVTAPDNLDDDSFYEVQVGIGRKVQVPARDIVHFKIPDPVNPYGRGSGVVASAIDEIDIDEFTAKHLRSFYYNRARPDFLAMAEGLTEEQTKRLEQRWLDATEGQYKAYRPFFANRKLEIHEFGQNFERMQLVDMRKFQRDIMQQLYGIPPEITGNVQKSDRNVSAADLIFSRFVVLPRLELQRQVLQKHLVPQYDDRIIIDYDSPLRADLERQMRACTIMPYTIKIDEWRAMQGLPPLGPPEGELFLVTNRVTVQEMQKAVEEEASG